MVRAVEYNNNKVAVAVASATLDVVIASGERSLFSVKEVDNHPLYDCHVLVSAETAISREETKWIRIDAENGNRLEVRL